MIRRIAVTAWLAALVSGCASLLEPCAADREQEGVSPPGVQACAAEQWSEAIVGRSIDEVDTDALPSPFRIYRAGDPVTADFRPDRLNVVIDADSRVLTVRCG